MRARRSAALFWVLALLLPSLVILTATPATAANANKTTLTQVGVSHNGDAYYATSTFQVGAVKYGKGVLGPRVVENAATHHEKQEVYFNDPPKLRPFIVGDVMTVRVEITTATDICAVGEQVRTSATYTNFEAASTSTALPSSASDFTFQSTIAARGLQGSTAAKPYHEMQDIKVTITTRCVISSTDQLAPNGRSETLDVLIKNVRLDNCPPDGILTDPHASENCPAPSDYKFEIRTNKPANAPASIGENIDVVANLKDPTWDSSTWSIAGGFPKIIDGPIVWQNEGTFTGGAYQFTKSYAVRLPSLVGDRIDAYPGTIPTTPITFTDGAGNARTVNVPTPADSKPPTLTHSTGNAFLGPMQPAGRTVRVDWSGNATPADLKEWHVEWRLHGNATFNAADKVVVPVGSPNRFAFTGETGVTGAQSLVTIRVTALDHAGNKKAEWGNVSLNAQKPFVDLKLANYTGPPPGTPPSQTVQVVGSFGGNPHVPTVRVDASDDEIPAATPFNLANIRFHLSKVQGGTTCYLNPGFAGTGACGGKWVTVGPGLQTATLVTWPATRAGTLPTYEWELPADVRAQLTSGETFRVHVRVTDPGSNVVEKWSNVIYETNRPVITASGVDATRLVTHEVQQGAPVDKGGAVYLLTRITDADTPGHASLDRITVGLYENGDDAKQALTFQGTTRENYTCQGLGNPACPMTRSLYKGGINATFEKTKLGLYKVRMRAADASTSVSDDWRSGTSGQPITNIKLGPRITFDFSSLPFYKGGNEKIVENMTVFAGYTDATQGNGAPCWAEPSAPGPVCKVDSIAIKYKAQGNVFRDFPVQLVSPNPEFPQNPLGGNAFYFRYAAPGNKIAAPSDMVIVGGEIMAVATVTINGQVHTSTVKVPLQSTLSGAFNWHRPEREWYVNQCALNAQGNNPACAANVAPTMQFAINFSRPDVSDAAVTLKVRNLGTNTYVPCSSNCRPGDANGFLMTRLPGAHMLNFTRSIALDAGAASYVAEATVTATNFAGQPYAVEKRHFSHEYRQPKFTVCTDPSFAAARAAASMPASLHPAGCEVFQSGGIRWVGREFNLSFVLETGLANVTGFHAGATTVLAPGEPASSHIHRSDINVSIERTAITTGQTRFLQNHEWSFTPLSMTTLDGKNETMYVVGRVRLPAAEHESGFVINLNATTDGFNRTARENLKTRLPVSVTFDATPPLATMKPSLVNASLIANHTLYGGATDVGSGPKGVTLSIVNLTGNSTWLPSTGRWHLNDRFTFASNTIVGSSWRYSHPGLTFDARNRYEVTVAAVDNLGNVQTTPRKHTITGDTKLPEIATLKFVGRDSSATNHAIGWRATPGLTFYAHVTDSAGTAVPYTTLKNVWLVVQNDSAQGANGLSARCTAPTVTCYKMSAGTPANNWTVTLADKRLEAVGAHTVWIYAEDHAGNGNESGIGSSPLVPRLRYQIVDDRSPIVVTVGATPAQLPVNGVIEIEARIIENHALAATSPVRGLIRKDDATFATFNMTPDASVAANGTGVWRWTNAGTNVTFPVGTYRVSVYAKDAVGNGCGLGQTSCPTYTGTTCPPNQSTCSAVSHNGYFEVTTTAPPTLTKQSPAGAFVNATPTAKIFAAHSKLTASSFQVQVRVGANGAYQTTPANYTADDTGPNGTRRGFLVTVPLGPYLDGTNVTLRVVATTSTGQVTTGTFDFEVDAIAPVVNATVTGAQTKDGVSWWSPDTRVTFDADDAGAGSPVVVYRFGNGSVQTLTGATLAPAGLPDGAGKLHFAARDAVGNQGAFKTLNFTFDKTGPLVTKSVDGAEPVVLVSDAGIGLDPTSVTLHVRYGASGAFQPIAMTNVSVNAFRATLSPEEGEAYAYYFTAKDLLGNTGTLHSAAVPHIVDGTIGEDNTPPIATLVAPADGAKVNGTVVLRWTATDEDGDTLTAKVAWANGNATGLIHDGNNLGTLSWDTRALAPGPYTVTLTVSDGKAVATDSATVTVQAPPIAGPPISVNPPPPSVDAGKSLTTKVAPAAGSKPIQEIVATIFRGAEKVAERPLVKDATGSYLLTYTPTEAGTYRISYATKYLDGSSAPAQAGGTFTVKAVTATENAKPDVPFYALVIIGATAILLAAYAAFVRWKP
ncbi:MAG TPA: hypothetical protein VM889_07465 [Candidatus Thermoplasmatota archaeon]|nr:hypothetical protein [Candidatus Thermoplasmatota archaeon]